MALLFYSHKRNETPEPDAVLSARLVDFEDVDFSRALAPDNVRVPLLSVEDGTPACLVGSQVYRVVYVEGFFGVPHAFAGDFLGTLL